MIILLRFEESSSNKSCFDWSFSIWSVRLLKVSFKEFFSCCSSAVRLYLRVIKKVLVESSPFVWHNRVLTLLHCISYLYNIKPSHLLGALITNSCLDGISASKLNSFSSTMKSLLISLKEDLQEALQKGLVVTLDSNTTLSS